MTDENPPPTPWHSLADKACFKELGCSEALLSQGLTTEEAKTRLEKYGENKLSEKRKVTLLERIWKQVANVLVAILVFVAAVSAVRAIMVKPNEEDFKDTRLTNWIQVGLILFVIT